MLALERQQKILSMLFSKKSFKVSELSQIFNVSPETIRNDLKKFEKEGIIIKGYGGAILNEAFLTESFNGKNKESVIQPQTVVKRLAYAIANEIKEGSVVILDNSEVSLEVATELKNGNKKVTIVTNYSRIINELTDSNKIELICIGGNFDRKTNSYIGSLTREFIKGLRANVAIIGCAGFSLERGVTEENEIVADIKRTMAEISNEIILALTEEDLKRKGVIKFLDIDDINTVVSTIRLSEKIEKYLYCKNVKIKYC